MERVENRDVAKYLIETKKITSFKSLLTVLPPATVAKVLNKNSSRMGKLELDPGTLKYSEIKKLAEYINIRTSEMIELIDAHYTKAGRRKKLL